MTGAATTALPRPLALRRLGSAPGGAASTEVWDGACGRCEPCLDGLRAHCLAPECPSAAAADDPRWRPCPQPWSSDELARACASAVDRVAGAGHAAPAVALVGGDEGVARKVAGVLEHGWARTARVVPAGASARDLAVLFAGTGGAGRADVALALDGDLRACAAVVRRGGAVASLVPPAELPALTTLVQRELAVVPARDEVAALLDINSVPLMHEKEADRGS